MALGNETPSSSKAGPFHQFHAWRGIAWGLVLEDVIPHAGATIVHTKSQFFSCSMQDLTKNKEALPQKRHDQA